MRTPRVTSLYLNIRQAIAVPKKDASWTSGRRATVGACYWAVDVASVPVAAMGAMGELSFAAVGRVLDATLSFAALTITARVEVLVRPLASVRT
jgi:hypothetical protein